MRILISIVLNGLGVFIASYLLKDGVTLGGVEVPFLGELQHPLIHAIITGAILGIVNALVKPIITLFTIPITIMTLGLFLLVINAAMVLLVDKIYPGFAVNGFWWALAFSVLLTVINFFLTYCLRVVELFLHLETTHTVCCFDVVHLAQCSASNKCDVLLLAR